MAVSFNKPSSDLRSKLNNLEKRIGGQGSKLLATETKQEAFNILGCGRKNLLINGACEIAQRGTSFSNVYDYTLDRWQVTRYAGTVNNVSQQDSGHIYDGPGLNKCIRHEFSTGGNGACFINQPIETNISKTCAGKWLTFSFWARTDSWQTGKSFDMGINYHTDSGWTDNGMYYFNFKNASTSEQHESFYPTSSWKRFYVTRFIPENVQQIGIGLINRNYSTGYIEFTGLQLEEGKEPTSFDHRLYPEEFALCQRYYQKTNVGYGRIAHFRTASLLIVSFDLPVSMRAINGGSMTNYNYWAYYDGSSPTVSGVQGVGGSQSSAFLTLNVTSGGIAGGNVFWYSGVEAYIFHGEL